MTHNLVPSDRVEGAVVYGADGEKLGFIERLMLDKRSGRVAYAVLRCSKTLSLPPHYFPVAWEALRYNPDSKAYETNLSMTELREGPNDLDGEAFDWGERTLPYHSPHFWTV